MERTRDDCERKKIALDAQTAAFDAARATASELTRRVSQQALSASDIKRLRETRTELRATLVKLQEQCEELTRVQHNGDRQLQSDIQSFEAHIRQYNNDAAELELLDLVDLEKSDSSTNPLLHCMLEARVPTELSGEQGLWAALERSRRTYTTSTKTMERPPFNVDFRGTTRLALRKFISDAKHHHKMFQNSIANLQQEEADAKDLLDTFQAELALIAAAKDNCVKEAERKAADAQSEIDEHQRKVAEYDASIALIDATGGVHELREVEEENRSVTAEMVAFLQQRSEAEKRRDSQVVEFLQRLAAHKESVNEELDTLYAHITTQCDIIANKDAPSEHNACIDNHVVVESLEVSAAESQAECEEAAQQ
jgi:SMC interacting uncharacterized protein involved in chromosome segregation